jgi:hypothetical protein
MEYLAVLDEVRVLCGTQTLNPNMFKTFVIDGPKNPFPNKIGPNPLFKKLNKHAV